MIGAWARHTCNCPHGQIGTLGTWDPLFGSPIKIPLWAYGHIVIWAHGNMAISYTPRSLYTMVGKGVDQSPCQYGYG